MRDVDIGNRLHFFTFLFPIFAFPVFSNLHGISILTLFVTKEHYPDFNSNAIANLFVAIVVLGGSVCRPLAFFTNLCLLF